MPSDIPGVPSFLKVLDSDTPGEFVVTVQCIRETRNISPNLVIIHTA